MARSTRKADWQGMNWIRQDKRLAIYLRDGMIARSRVFADAVAAYVDHGATGLEIVLRVSCLTQRSLAPFRAEAKAIMARRLCNPS